MVRAPGNRGKTVIVRVESMLKNLRRRSLFCWLGLPLAAVYLVACSKTTEPAASATGNERGVSLSEASLQFLQIKAVGTEAGSLGGILPGRVAFRPQAMAAVGTPMAARILSIDVRPGETIKAGTPLLTLQSADVAAARAALDQAAAKLAASEDLLQRQNEMIKKGVGLEVERFGAETAARQDRAELERARRTVALIGGGSGDRFVLRAPASGVVLTVKASIGAVVSPDGEALVEIGDPSRLWVVADIPESEIGDMTAGRAAEIRVAAVDARFDAVVDGVGQVVDGEQRRLPVYLVLKGSVKRLAPGMLAEVRLANAGNTALSLPTTSVLIKDGSQRVVYVQTADGKFEPRTVRTGVSREGRVTILEGLQAGEKVVTQGALLLDSEAEQLL